MSRATKFANLAHNAHEHDDVGPASRRGGRGGWVGSGDARRRTGVESTEPAHQQRAPQCRLPGGGHALARDTVPKRISATDEVLTLNDAAKLLGVCGKTVVSWHREYQLPAHRIGSAWRFLRSELISWIGMRGTNHV